MTTDVAVAVTSVEVTTYTYDRRQDTTSELVITSPRSSAGQSILMISVASLSAVAFIANLAMLICLLVYKQAASKNNVNTFICNQVILDLVTTFSGTVNLSLKVSGYLKTKTGVLKTFMIKLEIN